VTAIGVCTLLVTRDASALGPVDVEVAAKVGGGTNPGVAFTTNGPPGPAPPSPNALGFGLISFGLWIVGADANALWLVPSGEFNAHPAFTAHGQVGVRF
jgi:hypothetical protein